jgi:ABC-2 type transport system permease protein
MRVLWNIALNDLRQIFRERGVWINLVVIPIALAWVLGIANAGGGGGSAPAAASVILDVVDLDNSAASAEFIAVLKAANPNYILCPQDNDADDGCNLEGVALNAEVIESRLRAQTALAYLEIPAGYGAALDAGEDVQIVYRSNENAIAPGFILQAVQAVAQRLSAARVAERVGAAAVLDTPGLRLNDEALTQISVNIRERADALLDAQPPVVTSTSTTSEGVAVNAGSGFSQSVPGMATMYVMFAVFPAAIALMTERKQWTLQRLVTMPISRAQILGGKLLARFIVGMIQYGIVFAFGYLMGVRYGNDPVAILVTMIAFVLCITALTLALTTLLKSEAQASAISLLLSITLAPLGGAWWPLDIVPGWMQTLGHISPVAWAMNSYSELIFFGGNLTTVLPFIGVLLAMTAGFFLFGIARFRYE